MHAHDGVLGDIELPVPAQDIHGNGRFLGSLPFQRTLDQVAQDGAIGLRAAQHTTVNDAVGQGMQFLGVNMCHEGENPRKTCIFTNSGANSSVLLTLNPGTPIPGAAELTSR